MRIQHSLRSQICRGLVASGWSVASTVPAEVAVIRNGSATDVIFVDSFFGYG